MVTSSQAQALVMWLDHSCIPKDVPYQTAIDAIAELKKIAEGKDAEPCPVTRVKNTRTQER